MTDCRTNTDIAIPLGIAISQFRNPNIGIAVYVWSACPWKRVQNGMGWYFKSIEYVNTKTLDDICLSQMICGIQGSFSMETVINASEVA